MSLKSYNESELSVKENIELKPWYSARALSDACLASYHTPPPSVYWSVQMHLKASILQPRLCLLPS